MNDLKQDFLTYLEAERGYSPTTIATYKKALVSVEIFFKSIDSQLSWQTIDADVMRQWLAAQMERGEGARTMGKELSAVRSFYKYLRRMGLVDHNPMSLIQNPKAQKVLPSFLKEQEVERLFDDVDYGSDFVGVRNQTMLLTFYHTGVRMAELIGLNVNDIQLTTCELRVTGKRNKQRVVPFGLELYEALVKYLHVRQQFYGSSEGPVFITQKRQRQLSCYHCYGTYTRR
jgi:integrase/recombinase XerC